jgi:hypothetical protein
LCFIFCFACTKTESTLTPPTPTNPLVITPTVPAACPVVSISAINKKTSHCNPYFVPFTNYWALANDKATMYSCIGITGRVFLNINNNNIPDLVLTVNNGCSYNKGKTFVYVDNTLKWTFESPQILTRKMVRGDLNEDGSEDVVLFGTGYDAPPFPGEKNYIIYFKPDSYSIVELDNSIAYTHGGSLGDINNDGHLDVIPIPNQIKDCYSYIGDGKGGFVKNKLFDGTYTDMAFHSELYDVNSDGNLDIIMGGHEWDYPVRILFGNGKGKFNNEISIPAVLGWGTITDFDFYDLDKDGIEELIVTRTSGSTGNGAGGVKKNPNGFYDGFRIQVLKKNGNSYIQSSLLSSPSGWKKTWIQWIDWTSVADIDGDCNLDIVPDSENFNDVNYAELKVFNKLNYKGDGKGGFTLSYKK